MKKRGKMVMLYTRINGVTKLAIDNAKAPKQAVKAKLGMKRRGTQ